MPQIPRDRSPDSTLALLRDGYRFISKRCARHRSDVFETRLMLRKAVCMLGADAARIFYDGDRFTRKGAMPATTLMLLQDKGSVQLLDGEAHRRRKLTFMALLSPAALRQLVDAMRDEWRICAETWDDREAVVLFDELEHILCRAVCRWAGIRLTDQDARRRTRELSAMINGAGSVGPRNWRAQFLRASSERWARQLIRDVRGGEADSPEGGALHAIAWHREGDGGLLDPKTAAVELLNVLRPAVAVARFVTFAALALHEHPECREGLHDDECLERFVQEVRRFYPFFPFIAGRVRKEFDWRGGHFAAGTWVLLDLYGTDHDARIWQEPEAFRPERFRHWNGDAFDFIPQGGGDFYAGHRCPGEPATIELMKAAVRLLLALDYEVPEQDLRIALSRMPALPRSRFVIRPVRRSGDGRVRAAARGV